LVDIARESRVRITIIGDVEVETNIARIILLAVIEESYLKELNLPTPSLTPRGRSCC
jgi:hypothetical protein